MDIRAPYFRTHLYMFALTFYDHSSWGQQTAWIRCLLCVVSPAPWPRGSKVLELCCEPPEVFQGKCCRSKSLCQELGRYRLPELHWRTVIKPKMVIRMSWERDVAYIYICIRVYIYTYLSIVFGFPWHWMTHVRRIRWPFARSLRRCSLCFCSMCTPPQGCGWALERQILWCTSRESGSLCLKLSPMQYPGRSQYHDVVWNDCFFGWTLLKIFSRLSFLKMHSLKRMDMLLHMGLCETKVHQNWMVCHQSSLKSPFWGIPNFQTYWTSSRLQECCASKRGPWMSLVPWLSQQLIWSWI